MKRKKVNKTEMKVCEKRSIRCGSYFRLTSMDGWVWEARREVKDYIIYKYIVTRREETVIS